MKRLLLCVVVIAAVYVGGKRITGILAVPSKINGKPVATFVDSLSCTLTGDWGRNDLILEGEGLQAARRVLLHLLELHPKKHLLGRSDDSCIAEDSHLRFFSGDKEVFVLEISYPHSSDKSKDLAEHGHFWDFHALEVEATPNVRFSYYLGEGMRGGYNPITFVKSERDRGTRLWNDVQTVIREHHKVHRCNFSGCDFMHPEASEEATTETSDDESTNYYP